MATVSKIQSQAADWVLCTDSKELPWHSLLLTSVSPVLSGLLETKPREDGKISVPFRGSYQAAENFLQFCYHHNPVVLSVEECYELSLLSHEWNIQGLSVFCCMTGTYNIKKDCGPVCETISTMQILSAGLASLCDDRFVRLASRGDLLLRTPSHDSKKWSFMEHGSLGDMDVLDWHNLPAAAT